MKQLSTSMNKWLKGIIYLILALVTVSVIGAISLIIFVNPNQYKPLIIKQIKTATGADTSIGNISWKFFPQLGIEVDDISLQNNPQISQSPLLHMNSGALYLQILPLIHGQTIINEIIVNGAQINLIKDHSQNNWKFNSQTNDNSNTNFFLTLNKVKLQNISINYLDAGTKQRTTVSNLNLNITTENDGKIIYVSQNNIINLHKVDFQINSILQGTLDFSYNGTSYNGSLTSKNFSLPELLDSFKISNKAFSSNPWKNLAINASFSGNNSSLQLNNVKVNLGASTITTTAQVLSFSPLVINNDIRIDSLEASDFANLKGYHLKLTNLRSTGKIFENTNSGIRAVQNLQIDNLMLSGYDLHRLSAQIGTILSSPLRIITIPVTISQIQSSVKAAAGTEKKNLNINSNLGSLNAQLDYSGSLLRISQIYLSGPDLRASGNATVNTNSQQMNAHINAQFVASPNSLTGKIVYPVTISGNNTKIDWASVSSQLTRNMGSSLINTGKDVGGVAKDAGSATVNTTKKIGSTIKSWF